jgi:hypothetical protein
VDESTAPEDPSAQPEATAEAESDLSVDQPPETWPGGYGRGRFGCVRWCGQRFYECRSGYDRYDSNGYDRDHDGYGWDGYGGDRCYRRYERCMDRCRYGYGYGGGYGPGPGGGYGPGPGY